MSYIVYGAIIAAYLFSFYKLFPLAGRKSWEGLVPFYNLYVWLKVIQKPWWYLILLIFPGVNVLMIAIMSVNTATVFGRREASDVAQAGLLPFYYLPRIALDSSTKYIGPIDRKIHKKTSLLEWRDAILFAVVAASIIRTYFMEAFTIPTSSMEKTLLKGDFLFVSKFHYGSRIPQTPLSFPFTHHTLPLVNVKSYLEWIELPYWRLPALTTIENNDIVVFNFPAGDTLDTQYQSNVTYYQLVRQQAFSLIINDIRSGKRPGKYSDYINMARNIVKKERDIITRPVDKRENYIKRCVGIPGDVVEVKEGQLYINGERAFEPEAMQYNYDVYTKNPFALQSERTQRELKDNYLIDFEDQGRLEAANHYVFPLTEANSKSLLNHPNVDRVEFNLHEKNTVEPGLIEQLVAAFGQERAEQIEAFLKKRNLEDQMQNIYPNTPKVDWTVDFFGPLTIPKKGMTIDLTPENLLLYERAITAYEGNELYTRDGQVFINDQPASEYTFKMDYYWLMGDNRHNSQDSRFWGFVPEDHVVGKAVFIWLSLDPDYGLFDGKIRWSRLFTIIGND